MKIKNGFVLRTICGEKVVSPEGLDVIDFTKLVKLNETSAFLWESFEGRCFTPEDMAEALCDHYVVDSETALRDSVSFCSKLKELGIIE